MHMKRPLVALAALATFGALATPAHADTLSIPYRDLDLSTAEGQKALDRRIDVAVREFCALDQQRTGTRIASNASRRCYAETKRQATRHFAAIIDEQRVGG